MQRLQLSADDLSTAERPSVASTVTSLLKLCSSSKADIEIEKDGITLTVQGGPASVQPTRRGRGAGSRGAVSSLLWPDGFTWSLTVRLSDAESLVQLCDPPELLCTCSTCEDISEPFPKAAAALKFMDKHSGHNSNWSYLLDKQETALEQDLNSLLQQVKQHTDEGLVLPLQRAAALICVEAAHMVLLSDKLMQHKPLKQLAYTILHHRIIWHMTSSYRPAKQDDFLQMQLVVGPALAPHLLWLIAGAPPYGQTTSAAPDSAKSCGLEARALVAYLRRCHLFQQPGSKKGSSPYSAPSKQQLIGCLQQLLLLQQGSSNAGSSAASAAAAGSSKPLSQEDIDEDFINGLLALRGLQLHHLVEAAEEAGSTNQLDFCVLCGSSSSTTQERLMHCKGCCHSYHAHCALAAGNADGSYTMQTYPKVREGYCLGCQHFPLRTEAEGGLPWDSAAEDAEVEAAAAAAAGAAKHLARVKGTSTARNLPGAAAIAAVVAAAAAADDHETAGNSSSSGGMPRISPTPSVKLEAPPAAAAAKSSKPPLVASTAVNSSSNSGAPKANKHLIRGPNGKFVSLKQLGQLVKDEKTPSRSGGTAAAPAGGTAAAAGGGGGGGSTAAVVGEITTRAGSYSGAKPKRLSSASAADDSTPAAAAAAAGSSKGGNGKVVLCCQPLIPGSEAPEATEPTDIDQVRTFVLDRLLVLNLVPTGDSGMLLRRALLKEGLKFDYVDNQGQVAVARFEVVTATAGRKGEKQQLICHACEGRLLATWKEAEDHLNYDSGGHSTQFLKFVGTKISVKELWFQVQELYKQKVQQQQAGGKQQQSNKQQQSKPQQQGKNPTASPAMDAAHALQMLATACDLPFGASEGGNARARTEQQQRKRRAEAALSADASSLELPDLPVTRKRRHIVQQHRASSSNVSDTITAPLGDGSPPDEARSSKRRRLLLLQQQTPDPLKLRWRLARVPVMFRQHLEQLLSLDAKSLQLCAFFIEFWSADSGGSSTGGSPTAEGGAAPEAGSGNSSPAATTPTAAAAASSIVWDLEALESDGVVGLMAGAAKASVSSSSSTTEAAVEVTLEACLECIKELYSLDSDQQQEKQQLDLVTERRRLVVSMLQLAVPSLSGSSGSSSVCAALLDVVAVAVCSNHINAQQLQQLRSLCDMLQQLMGSLSQQVWPLLATALQKHLDAAAADLEDQDRERHHRHHRHHDDDHSQLSLADEESARAISEGQWMVLRALQQLLELIMQAPAAWDAALVRKCSSQSAAAGSSSVLEVTFEAIYQGCVLQEQYAAEQAKLQQQEEAALAAAAAICPGSPQEDEQQQQQPVDDVMPAEGQQQQPGKVAQGGNAPSASADDVLMTDADVDQQQQQQEVDTTVAAAASPSEVQQQQQEGEEDDVIQLQDVDADMAHEAVDLTHEQQQQQQDDDAEAEEPLTAEARQERRKAAEDLLGPFMTALAAAATWLASTQQQQQKQKPQAAAAAAVGTRHKAEDLLVGLVWLQYQVLRVLLLTDAQLQNVLQFVAGGLQTSLVEYAADALTKATAAFTAAAAATPAAASSKAAGGKVKHGGSAQQQKDQQQGDTAAAAADCGMLAYDCRYIGDSLAETVGYVVKNKRR